MKSCHRLSYAWRKMLKRLIRQAKTRGLVLYGYSFSLFFPLFTPLPVLGTRNAPVKGHLHIFLMVVDANIKTKRTFSQLESVFDDYLLLSGITDNAIPQIVNSLAVSIIKGHFDWFMIFLI